MNWPLQLSKCNWNGLWIVEWSNNKKCFHIENAETRFKDSIDSCVEARSRGDWIALGIFNSLKEGKNFIEELEEIRDK